MAPPRVAVVGGGLAGLAAAVALKDAGSSVELFERSRLLGGRATSFVVDGHEVDNGQHVFLQCCTAFIDFVARLGMRDQIHVQERFDALVLSGTAHCRLHEQAMPAPLHLVWSLLGYRHLDLGARIGIGRTLLAARGALGSDEPFDAWLRRHGQSDAAFHAFWEPFVVPALNAPLDRVTAGDAAFVLVTAFLSDRSAARFGWSKVPLARIAEAAAARLDRVHTSTAVTGIDAAGKDVTLTFLSGEPRAFDAVVLALTPPHLERLLEGGPRLGIPPLDGYEARAIVDVHVWHDGPALDFEFAALVDSPVQWIFEKGPGYLCCSMSAADDVLTAPVAELATRCWSEVQAAIPQLAEARLVREAVTRNPSATFTARPGVKRPGVRTAAPNVTIAGAWIETGWPDTMESAVRSGLDAAHELRGVPFG